MASSAPNGVRSSIASRRTTTSGSPRTKTGCSAILKSEKHHDCVTPDFRQTELINAVEKLSGDLCISRPKSRLSWGIELPFDPDYVNFVWFDALTNYISFIGYDPAAKDFSAQPAAFREKWPALHIIGKDILIPAHGIYWPIMLHALGFPDEQMPKFLVHGWWNISGTKMSKSLGNVIDPDLLAEKYGGEALRYYLMSDMVIGQDADFLEFRIIERHDGDLANSLGNLLNRTLNMAARYSAGSLRRGNRSKAQDFVQMLVQAYRDLAQDVAMSGTMDRVIEIANEANQLIEKTAPWKMMKEGQTKAVAEILYDLVDWLRIIAILISPVLPKAAHGIFDQLNWKMELSWRPGSALLVSRRGVGEAARWTRRRETDAIVPAHRGLTSLPSARRPVRAIALLPFIRKSIALTDRSRLGDTHPTRQSDLEELQDLPQRPFVILAESLVFDAQGKLADADEKCAPDAFVIFSLGQAAGNQGAIVFWFRHLGFALLHFPEPGLNRASFRDRLAQFFATADLDKTQTRKRAAEHLQIRYPDSPKRASLPKPREEAAQVPSHQLESKNFVGRRRLLDNPAHVVGEIHRGIETVFRAKLDLRRGEKEMVWVARAARIPQSVAQQVAPGPSDRADEITPAWVSPIAKQSRHDSSK